MKEEDDEERRNVLQPPSKKVTSTSSVPANVKVELEPTISRSRASSGYSSTSPPPNASLSSLNGQQLNSRTSVVKTEEVQLQTQPNLGGPSNHRQQVHSSNSASNTVTIFSIFMWQSDEIFQAAPGIHVCLFALAYIPYYK